MKRSTARWSYAKLPAETSRRVVRLRAVVIHEDLAVAPVAEQRAAEGPDVGRCTDPAGRRRVELAERLQVPVLVLGQEFDAHRGSHVDGAALRLVLLAGLERLTVVADTSASCRALCGAIAERVPAR